MRGLYFRSLARSQLKALFVVGVVCAHEPIPYVEIQAKVRAVLFVVQVSTGGPNICLRFVDCIVLGFPLVTVRHLAR